MSTQVWTGERYIANGCVGKQRYRSRSFARKVARSQQSTKGRMVAYRCLASDVTGEERHYHVGHPADWNTGSRA